MKTDSKQFFNTSRYVEHDGRTLLQWKDSLGDTRYFDATTGKELEQISESVGEDTVEPELLPMFDRKYSDPIAENIDYLKRFIFLKDEAEYILMATMPLLSFCCDSFERIPYLWITGQKGSGKTTLMAVMKPLVYDAVFVSEISSSALFRIINESSPTLFLDEAEQLKKRQNSNQPMFQILNSGYQRDGSVLRTENKMTVQFSTYGLKFIAGINSLHPTLADRAIHVHMEIPPASVELERFNSKSESDAKPLLENLRSALNSKYMELKEKINNASALKIDPRIRMREADKWYPVLTLASLFSNRKNDYFSKLQDLAIKSVEAKIEEDLQTPENMCSAIIKDFLQSKSERTRFPDPHFFYFPTEEVQKVIEANDPYNYYRDKAEFTRTLKRIGIDTDRRRIGQRDPVLFYKIPRSFLK